MGAVDAHGLAARLLAQLPDEPQWIETRAILRSLHGQLFAGPVVDEGVVVRWVHDAMSAVAVVGRPPAFALESNTSSLRLAAKLGFTPAGANVAFARGPWAYLTLAYTG